MIYILISDLGLTRENEENNKRDCRILRQPPALLPEEIREYIDGTKNENTRAERNLAYTSLLSGLKILLNIVDCNIEKDADGKPFLVTKDKNVYQKEGKKIYISLSHSDYVSAVCISDEGDVGIDIQSEIDSARAERLKERFLGNIEAVNSTIDVEIYYCSLTPAEVVLEAINLADCDDGRFTSKWVMAESLMKLYGRGFGDLSRVKNNTGSTQTYTMLKKYIGKNTYYLALSVYK